MTRMFPRPRSGVTDGSNLLAAESPGAIALSGAPKRQRRILNRSSSSDAEIHSSAKGASSRISAAECVNLSSTRSARRAKDPNPTLASPGRAAISGWADGVDHTWRRCLSARRAAPANVLAGRRGSEQGRFSQRLPSPAGPSRMKSRRSDALDPFAWKEHFQCQCGSVIGKKTKTTRRSWRPHRRQRRISRRRVFLCPPYPHVLWAPRCRAAGR